MNNIERKLPSLPLSLKKEILEKGILKNIPAKTEILKEGQFLKVIPLVLEGSLKVFSSYEDKELLLYYIEPAESCIMSFSAGLGHYPSKVFAIAEKDNLVNGTKIFCKRLIMSCLTKWTKEFLTI